MWKNKITILICLKKKKKGKSVEKSQNKGTQPSYTLDVKHIQVWKSLFFTFHTSTYERAPSIKSVPKV